MPIAQCFVAPDLAELSADIVALWAARSGQPADDMTLNLITVSAQFGQPCAVVATLMVPALWDGDAVAALGVGLAGALAEGFSVPPSEVVVCTQVLPTSLVVADGAVLSEQGPQS